MSFECITVAGFVTMSREPAHSHPSRVVTVDLEGWIECTCRTKAPATVAVSTLMPRIFLSYRREDASAHAGRLYDSLVQRFGKDQVFRDIDTIRPGDDFVNAIHQCMAACDVCLVLIGRQWMAEQHGARRLDDPGDYVRLEVAAALDPHRDIRVIPVLVDGGHLPASSELPPELAPLARRQAIELSEARFHDDVERLSSVLSPTRASASRVRQFKVFIFTLVLLAATIAAWITWHTGRTNHAAVGPTVERWGGNWFQESSAKGGSLIAGTLTLTTQKEGQVEGHYEYRFEGRAIQGRLQGQLDSSSIRLNGIWTNNVGQTGQCVLQLNADGNSFQGLYSVSASVAPENPNNWWRGKRQ